MIIIKKNSAFRPPSDGFFIVAVLHKYINTRQAVSVFSFYKASHRREITRQTVKNRQTLQFCEVVVQVTFGVIWKFLVYPVLSLLHSANGSVCQTSNLFGGHVGSQVGTKAKFSNTQGRRDFFEFGEEFGMNFLE